MIKFKLPVLSAAAALVLSGCSAVVPWKSDFDGLEKAKPIALDAASLIKKEGFSSFHDSNVVDYKLKKAADGSYAFSSSGSAFDWGPGGIAVLRGGLPKDLHAPKSIRWTSPTTAVIRVPVSGRDIDIKLEIQPYDISGLSIASFMRTPGNLMHRSGYALGSEYKFPKGSIGYKPILTIDHDEVIVQSKARFTGSRTMEEFTERFSKQTPYCAKFLPRGNAVPFGITFDKPTERRLVRKKNGTLADFPQSGDVYLTRVKNKTLFCKRDSDEHFEEGGWKLSRINNTRVMTLSFPRSIAPQDYGVPPEQHSGISIGFAEQGRMGSTKVVPVYVWKKNAPIPDAKWRFNSVAADAVNKALKSLPKEAKNKSKNP